MLGACGTTGSHVPRHHPGTCSGRGEGTGKAVGVQSGTGVTQHLPPRAAGGTPARKSKNPSTT